MTKHNRNNRIDSVLQNESIARAFLYYGDHADYVHMIIDGIPQEKAYPPSQLEDKQNPQLWKPEHWRWFLQGVR